MRNFTKLGFVSIIAAGVVGLSVPAHAQGFGAPRAAIVSQVFVPDGAGTPEASAFGDRIWLAQECSECGGDQGGYARESPSDAAKSPSGVTLNMGTTNKLVRFLTDADKTCKLQIAGRYRMDCLRVYYGWLADSLPNTGEYLPIKTAMRQAERKLERIIAANVDTSAPRVVTREGNRVFGRKLPPLRAIKKSSAKRAVAQAAAVIEETRIVILRSGEDPTRRTAHYEKVSAALDSNIVLLRST